MPLMRWFCILLFSLFVTACGGGGTIDKTDNNSGGSTSGDYELSLTIIEQTNELSLSTPLTVEATLKNDGAAVANTRVNFTTDVYARFVGSSSVLTDSNGKATVKLMPTNQQGAGAVTASVSLSESTLEKSIDYSGLGDGGLRLSTSVIDIDGKEISVDNPLSQSRSGLVKAELLFDGKPVTGETIEFQLDTLAFTNNNAKVETNSQGIALLAIQATREAGAGEIIVTYENEQSVANFTTLGNPYFGEQVYEIALSGVNALTGEAVTSLSVATPIKLQAQLTLNGQALSNQTIEFSSDGGAELDKTSALTDADGFASTILTANSVAGSGVVNTVFSSQSGTQVVSSYNYTSLGDGGIQMNITVLDSEGNPINESNPLSVSKPAIVTVKVVDDQIAKSGAIVEVNAGDQGTLDFSSRLTQANGEAMFILKPNTVKGLGIITATYKGTSQTPSTDNINVQNTYFSMGFSTDSISIDIAITDSTGNAITDANRIGENKDAFVTISLTEGNTPLANKFITVDVGLKGVTVPSDGRVVTDANGQARLVLQANTQTGAEALTATYRHNDDSDVVGVQPYYTDGNPKFDIDPYKFVFVAKNESDSNVSNQLSGTNPLILEAQLLFNNAPVQNSRVKFTVDEFATLDHKSGSILTNSQGVATVRLLDNDLEGAGRATVTFEKEGGDLVATLDFNSAGTGGITLTVGQVLDDAGQPITSNNPVSAQTNGFVTVTLTENNQPINNALILVQGDAIATTRPSNGKIATDVNGEATFELVPTTEAGLGEFTVTYQQTANLSFVQTAFFHSSGNPREETSTYDIDVRILTGCNDDWDENRATVELNPDDPSTGCTDSSRISSNELAEVFVKLSSKQSGTALTREIVNVATTIGQILPSSGTALTDEFGVALLKLQPGDNGGAGTVSATYDGETNSSNFSVGVVDLVISLDNGLEDGVTELKAGGSTVITATLRDEEGNLYLTPADVNFSSVCANNGEAQLDAQVKSSNGEATATYRANGCSITDKITATVEAGGNNFVNSIELTVSESPAQALKFLTTNENFEQFIALPPGEGGAPTLSVVEFQLLDEDKNPIKQKRIDFRLTDSIGAAGLTQSSSSTDNDGKAQTTVTSGLVPGPLVVQACYIPDNLIDQVNGTNQQVTCWPDEFDRCDVDPKPNDCPAGGYVLVPISEQITGISSRILLSSGVTDQDSFDAAPVTLNLNSLTHVGATVDINIYFGDQFNQLSGDGVTATVQSETGVVGTFDGEQFNELYNCQSTDATCTLTWRNQGDAPFSASEWQNTIADVCDTYFGNAAPCIGTYPTTKDGRNIIRGGRVSFLVTAKGQETFVDKPGTNNRNGRFDEGEYHSAFDLPEAFLDINDNGSFDAKTCLEGDADDPCAPANSDGGHNEIFRDINNNGIHDAADGIYNGLLCSEDAQTAGACSKDLIEVRKQFSIVMSGDTPYVRFAVPSTVGGVNCASQNGLILEASDNASYCDILSVTLGDDGVESVPVYIFYSDINGNPLPAGTEIEISTTNGKLDLSGGDAVVPNAFSNETSYSIAKLSREVESNGQEVGLLSVQFTFTKPDGTNEVISYSLDVNDANP
jgi:uncharacterized GH25 family protein